jgi:hypothetical protein
MACQKCGDEVWSDGNTWRHDDEDEKGLDDDHEGEPSDEDEEQDNRDRWESEMESRREQKELGHPKMSMFRSAAINFLAGQNTTDREELLFRAHRHASNLTGQLPVPVAQRAVQEFVATVSREAAKTAACPEDGPCDGCNAEAGEECRPWCTGEQSKKNEKADKKHSHRTAAVTDFPDELMF